YGRLGWVLGRWCRASRNRRGSRFGPRLQNVAVARLGGAPAAERLAAQVGQLGQQAGLVRQVVFGVVGDDGVAVTVGGRLERVAPLAAPVDADVEAGGVGPLDEVVVRAAEGDDHEIGRASGRGGGEGAGGGGDSSHG